MVNVSTNDSKISINVTSAGTKGIVEAQNDKSKYYEELAKQHEENAKASELLAKDWANKLGDTVDGVEYSAKHYAEEAEATLTEVESAKVQAIADIQEQEGSSISALNVEKGSILVDLANTKDEILGDISDEGNAQVNVVAGAGTTAISNINSTKTTAISAVDAEANTQKQALVNVSNAEQTKLQGYVNQAQESATNAHNSEIYCKEVIERIGTAIKIKGRVNTFEDLPKAGNLDGDAYLVGLEGLSSYPEYYWFENHWEFLGTSGGGGAWGTITGNITEQTDLQNALDGKQPTGDYALKSELPSLEGYATESYVQGYHDSTKQDVIPDLATIRDGASKGATAIQNTNDCVHLTGNETISGDKTFNNKIKLTSGTDSSSGLTYMLGIKAFVDGGDIIYSHNADVTVGTATKATQDGNGNVITTTYQQIFDIDLIEGAEQWL